MKTLEKFAIQDSGTLLNAVEKIELNHSRAVIILKKDVVTGVISEGDIMRALLRGVDIHAPLKEFVRSSFLYLHKPDKTKAFEFCRKHAITLVPIVDNDFRLKGVLTLKELLQEVCMP